MLRKLINIFKNPDEMKNQIKIQDEVIVHYIKSGHTIKTLHLKGHTWTTTGLSAIRNALHTGNLNAPNSFSTDGSPTSFVPANWYDTGNNTVAAWKGTFGSGSISNITAFRLCYNDSIYATIHVAEGFNKIYDSTIELLWRTTISPG